MQITTLEAPALQDCLVHLDALDRLRVRPLGLYRSDIISHLTLVRGRSASWPPGCTCTPTSR